MTIEMNTRISKELVSQLSNKANEPDWMLDLRLKALSVYEELPNPQFGKTKINNWNIDQFKVADSQINMEGFNSLSDNVKDIIKTNEENRNVIIQKGSTIVYQQIADKLADQGVIFTNLNEALQKHPDIVRKYFMNNFDYQENKIIALHTALWNGGVFLYVPKNIEVELPIQALYLGDGQGILPHILIVAEANSSIISVDNYLSADANEASVHNGIVELYVGEGAKVRYATIHSFNNNSYDYTYRKAKIARNGKIEWIIGEMNSGNMISENASFLQGDGAEADVKTIFIGTGNQRANFESKVVHTGQHTESNILSHGVMLDSSTAVFNGVTKIEKGATKSNAAQAEKVLMLSPNSRGDANPILLIDEHDVKAGHAASAGPVNPNDIFYLTSRGITEKEAKRLIIRGFLAPVVSRIPVTEVKEQLEKVIERKLVQ